MPGVLVEKSPRCGDCGTLLLDGFRCPLEKDLDVIVLDEGLGSIGDGWEMIECSNDVCVAASPTATTVAVTSSALVRGRKTRPRLTQAQLERSWPIRQRRTIAEEH